MLNGMRGSTIFGIVLGVALLISLVNSLGSRSENDRRRDRREVEPSVEDSRVQDSSGENSDGLSSETRNVGSFDALSLVGVGNVTVSLGDEPSVVVRAPDNLLRELRTRVEGGTLKLETERQTRLLGGSRISGSRVSYEVVTPRLAGLELSGTGDIRAERIEGDDVVLELSGSGNLYVEDLRADELEVNLSGEGDMQLAGEVSEQSVTVSGVGSYRACGLESEDAEVDVSGVGDALVWATDTLDAAVSGVGSVGYRDDPEVSADVSGIGSVTRSGSCN